MATKVINSVNELVQKLVLLLKIEMCDPRGALRLQKCSCPQEDSSLV